jgi:hypothetical protein
VNQEFVLGKLSDLMRWDDENARREFAWLRLMSRMKYDGYQEFLAGMRFIENLTDWLQQFKAEHRTSAYTFIRENLVFISLSEMRHLVELFYPETVQPRLIREVAQQRRIPPYRVWADADAASAYHALLRKTLFIELSDGGRIDVFRRANAGVIGNEQIVTAPRINEEKWKELLGDLRKKTEDDAARFSFVYLVDDFTASGTSLLRQERGKWKGKLWRFWEDVRKDAMTNAVFEDDWKLCVHHYISTTQSENTVKQRDSDVRAALGADVWFNAIELSSGMRLPGNFAVTSATHPDFGQLIQAYYDESIAKGNEHMMKGGDDCRYGFGQCGLPLVLEHNTPNNSLALLWAETSGEGEKHAMRPLFRRRQRHS